MKWSMRKPEYFLLAGIILTAFGYRAFNGMFDNSSPYDMVEAAGISIYRAVNAGILLNIALLSCILLARKNDLLVLRVEKEETELETYPKSDEALTDDE